MEPKRASMAATCSTLSSCQPLHDHARCDRLPRDIPVLDLGRISVVDIHLVFIVGISLQQWDDYIDNHVAQVGVLPRYRYASQSLDRVWPIRCILAFCFTSCNLEMLSVTLSGLAATTWQPQCSRPK